MPAALLALTTFSLVTILVVLRDRWERWWFEFEDPRPIAAFRVAFAILVVWDIDGLAPHFELLFTSRGLFDAASARSTFGGWSDDAGMLTIVVHAIRGTFSLLWLGDAAWAWPVVLTALHVSALLLAVGLWSRGAAISTIVLFDTVLLRNPVFWEGTEIVLRDRPVVGTTLRAARGPSPRARRAGDRDLHREIDGFRRGNRRAATPTGQLARSI